MKSLKHTLLMACLFFSGLSASTDTAEGQTSSNFEYRLQQLNLESENNRLTGLFNLYWEWKMLEFPTDATWYGFPGQNHRWPDYSLEAIQRRNSFLARLLQVLVSIDPIPYSQEEKLSHQILKREIEEELQNIAFNLHYMPIDQMHGIQIAAPMVIELMPAKNVEDYENIIARLTGFRTLIEQTMVLLKKGLEVGMTPPKITLSHVPQQILNQISDNPFESPYLTAFKNMPNSIDSKDQERLCKDAEQAYLDSVVPSLFSLYSYLVNYYIPNSRKSTAFSDLPNGKELYAFKVRTYTTTELTPDEIHEIGLKEVQRIRKEMLEIIASLEFKGSYSDFLHFLESDPQFFYKDRQSLLEGYRQLTGYIEKQLPLLFHTLPQQPFEVIPVPSYSEESQIGAYYCPGSMKEQRPGYFFINTSFPEKRPMWEMEPLSLHEAVPGHHLQISIAQELTGLPEFRKNANYTAYIEGWGLYAESLGKELGLYKDPYSRFGKLSYEMMRAIRLVVDTGMHAKGWSRQDAINYFKEYLGWSEHETITEVDRYLVLPGQALAYKIGELKLQELRQLAEQKLGDIFDIRNFHHAWLSHGALPLDTAEQLMKEWIQEELDIQALLKTFSYQIEKRVAA